MRISKIVLFVCAIFCAVNVNAKVVETAKYTAKDKEAAEYCKNLDVQDLEDLKAAATTSAIGGVIGAAGGVAGIATGVASTTVQKKGGDSTKTKAEKGLDIASTVTSAISGVGSSISVVSSGIGLDRVQSIFDSINKCVEKMKEI